MSAWGANLHNFSISPVEEDYDDAFLQMWFRDGLVSQVVVSRNHVAGYRNETWIYGEEGMVHVGHFEGNASQVAVAAYGREGVVERKTFEMRGYGEDAPVFMARFGEAYKQELATFIEQCLAGAPFSVNQDDGLRAMEIAETGARALQTGQDGLRISYHH